MLKDSFVPMLIVFLPEKKLISACKFMKRTDVASSRLNSIVITGEKQNEIDSTIIFSQATTIVLDLEAQSRNQKGMIQRVTYVQLSILRFATRFY
jgi:hypothetical protein